MIRNIPAVEQLIEAFRKLPGVGKRSAERLAFHLLTAPQDEARVLSDAIRNARERVTFCSVCRNLTGIDKNPCAICSDPRREASTICVVEHPTGAMAIENGGTFRGLYHVLHGALNPLEGIGPDELQVEKLMRRLSSNDVCEVIIATDATTEGEATALYLAKRVTSLGIATSRIAHGVPMGGGLEYADGATVGYALEGRTKFPPRGE